MMFKKLYWFFISKNKYIKNEYNEIIFNQDNKRKNKIRSRFFLIWLNFKYRILRVKPKSTPNPQKNYKLESEHSKHKNLHVLAKQNRNYDVISFKFLNTLIFKKINNKRVFYSILGKRLSIDNFYRMRVLAEKEVEVEVKNEDEINLKKIYMKLEKLTGLEWKKGLQAEIELEKKFSIPNPYMQSFFYIMKGLGKKVSIVYDGVLTQGQVLDLLENCGYKGFDKVFRINKKAKADDYELLYDRMKNEYVGDSIKHFGPDRNNDYNIAIKNGVDAFHYKDINVTGNKFRTKLMSSFISESYSNIINIKLHSQPTNNDAAYEYGFTYGGIFLLGFCNWIKSKCGNNNKVLFLSSVGELLPDVCKVNNLIIGDRVLFSEFLLMKGKIRNNKFEFLNSYLTDIIKRFSGEITFKELLTLLDIEELQENLSEKGIEENLSIEKNGLDIVKSVLDENFNLIIDKYEKDIKNYYKYLSKIIGKSNKITLISGEPTGEEVKTVKNIIENFSQKKIDVTCLLPFKINDSGEELMYLEKIEAYTFSRLKNNSQLENFDEERDLNLRLVKFLFMNLKPEIKNIYEEDNGLKFEFLDFDLESYRKASIINKGIEDFIYSYKHTFPEDEFQKIYGSDAFMPILEMGTAYKEFLVNQINMGNMVG